MGFAPRIAGLLEHAEDAIVALDMVVGAIDMVPSQADNQLVEFVLGQFFQRPSKKVVGLIVGVSDHAGAPIARLLLADALLK